MPEVSTSSNTPIPAEVREETLPEPDQKVFEGKPFPLILVPKEDQQKSAKDWSKWAESERKTLKKLMLEYGAILFRGFPINCPEDFDEFSKSFGFEHFPYFGGTAVRQWICGNVFTANECPPESRIPFHHEMGHKPVFPLNVFFHCDVAAPEGGQTPVILSNVVYQEMLKREPDFVKKLEQGHLVFTGILPNEDDPTSPLGNSWRSTFQTDDKAEAEKRCLAAGTNFEWLPDGSMKTFTNPIPGIRKDERSGKNMWHNSIDGCPDKIVKFENGDQIPPNARVTLTDVLESNCVNFTWKKGDVLVVDNRICQHARRSYKPPRRTLVVLCKD